MVASRIAGTGIVGPIRMPPPMRFPVEVKVKENDPAMTIKAEGRTLSISGVASNRGVVPSFAQFEVDGRKINLSLSGGMTGAKVLAALAKRLPSGLSIQGSAASFQIMRGGPTRPAGSVEQINTIFANARAANSPGKGLITTSELRAAFKAGLATAGKLSVAEKNALAQNWASTFTGAGFLATPAAQQEYARLQKKYDLPVIPIF